VPVEAGICASSAVEVDSTIGAAVEMLSETAAISAVAVEAIPSAMAAEYPAAEVTIAASPCVVAAPSPTRAAAKIDLEKYIFPDILE
jgi:hypothetical protein